MINTLACDLIRAYDHLEPMILGLRNHESLASRGPRTQVSLKREKVANRSRLMASQAQYHELESDHRLEY